MPLEIPGYYFDPDKKKYFKIEKAQTAPTTAAWSADAVKKRKVEAGAEQTARRREWLVRRHVKRHTTLRGDVVSWGLLGMETGGSTNAREVGAAGWAEGVVRKGEVPFGWRARERGEESIGGGNVPCLWVGGEDEKTGLGVAYSTVDEETLVGSYVPTDGDGRIYFDKDAVPSTGRRLGHHIEPVRCPQMSSIGYHAPSHRILLTSREPDHSCGLYLFSPPLTDMEDYRPHWLLGETNFYQRLSMRHRQRNEWLVHGATPAPPSSDLVCVMGTNAGVVRVASNETMALLAPQQQGPRKPKPPGPAPREVFDMDFKQGDHNVLFAGGRQPRLWMSDMRTEESEWSYVKHASSIAALRSVNEHQVLVLGLEHSMTLYDMRFVPQSSNGRKPLLTFPQYRNEAHLHVGFDVSPQLGTIAAAQDDGTVAIFSLSSGRRMRCPAVDGIRRDRPVRGLMFSALPGERTPSLWVGEGMSIGKYSFGAGVLEDEL